MITQNGCRCRSERQRRHCQIACVHRLKPVATPDLEEDFDAAIGELAKDAIAEHNSVPEHLRNRHYMRKACEAVIFALDLDPSIDVVLSMQLQRLIRNAERLHAEIPEEFRYQEDTSQ